ncbi:malonic semialdehyde reductase [Streptomyces lavendulae]|uniref:Putative malonic semialdehyde reductase RutE n=1 Tax=Streptomyces lavendulae subsp. lavendulae TaxID=58340 RepID=A0A2K8PDA0_STRLA|nr:MULTISPECIES: malonic semialdehyde reductase [Streptomyces]ATZ24712.1 putative malonic semialdehyde reductase RutE [Streptomyces lavendulae subsp. lavendulae]MDH6540818.1 3-hydroxypropanoate dehydrogenase [Streptomyces sp. SPB4]QUQ54544.1 putative malonic semialdehyde reductase RutE [Streptomyces lavendulae subsp. lavendulae]GLV98988.1 putative NADH dehydrogenase/NAD(P)H nitroreductase [Streptomyces lavendulae subsp. lavendulae]
MSLVLDAAAQDLLFREARTANSFSDEPVTEEQVQAIYDLVKFGPTAFNQTPLRITLVRSPEARERLVKHMAEGNQAKTAAAPLVAILSADNEFHEELPQLLPHFPQAKDAFFSERPVREQSALVNASLQAAYFIVGVRAAGLAAGPMTGLDFAGVQKEFLDADHTPLMVVNIGKPGENAWFPRSPRLDFDQVVTTV